jgi:type IX secretion system PorP/SprF family membrane protein
MTKLKLSFWVLIMCVCNAISAQQMPHYSMYMFNNLYFNPATAGNKSGLSGSLIYRHQWQSLEGAPKMFSLSVHSPLKNNKINLGVHINTDKVGVYATKSIFGAFAYRIHFDNNMKLSFGIQAGLKQNTVNLNEIGMTLKNPDGSFAQNYALTGFDGGFGMMFHSDKFVIGASLPSFLYNNITTDSGKVNLDKSIQINKMPIMANAAYAFEINETWSIKPSVFFKIDHNAPLSADFNLGAHYKNVFYFGGGYRLNNSINATVVYNFTKNWRLGYTYEFSTATSVKGINDGTHEIMLGFDIMDLTKNSTCKCRVISPRQFRYF